MIKLCVLQQQRIACIKIGNTISNWHHHQQLATPSAIIKNLVLIQDVFTQNLF